MNADKRIRYLESQLTRQRKEIRSLRIALDERDREVVDLRKAHRSRLTLNPFPAPRQPSLDELVLGYGE